MPTTDGTCRGNARICKSSTGQTCITTDVMNRAGALYTYTYMCRLQGFDLTPKSDSSTVKIAGILVRVLPKWWAHHHFVGVTKDTASCRNTRPQIVIALTTSQALYQLHRVEINFDEQMRWFDAHSKQPHSNNSCDASSTISLTLTKTA